MRIAIIGAGLTGLTAGYKLAQKKNQVTIFEKGKAAGGLAAGFKQKGWDWSLEYFFHHLFTSDTAAQKLIAELGLSDKLFYLQPKSSIFYHGKISQFDSPASLLSFPALTLFEKIRTGLVTTYLKLNPNWQSLEDKTAVNWLPHFYGQKPFQILWEPLLASKFDQQKENIAMSWFWARIKKRSQRLGYLRGGFQVLIDQLTGVIKKNGGKIFLNQEIVCLNDLNHLNRFDQIIFTIPTLEFLKIVPSLPRTYKVRLGKLEMIGAINLILILKERVLPDNTYWLNINESGFPFVAVVEHTNFVDSKYYGGNHILYVGGYYPQNHRYFQMSKEEIFQEFLPYLQQINPNYDFKLCTLRFVLCASLYAQPIIPTNYSKLIPPYQTPIPGVYLANMQQIYPWDRGINYAVELGEKVVAS